MNTFTFTTDYADCGDLVVTVAVDGSDLFIVAALRDGAVIDTSVILDGHRVSIEALLLEAAGDYARENNFLVDEDIYPNRGYGDADRRAYSDY